MTTQYRASIVGGIWWPMGAICALDVGPFDEAREVERGALPANPTVDDLVDYVTLHHAGDFSSVQDVEVWRIDHEHKANADGRIVENVRRSTLVKAFSEEAELAYSDCMAEPEPDEAEPDRAPTFTLVDDGTLDTVVKCDACGQEERYTLEPVEDFPEGDNDARIAEAMSRAADDHECTPD